MFSRLVITFLARSKRLLISWLQSSAAVILEPSKIKSDTVSTLSPSISHEQFIILSNVLLLASPAPITQSGIHVHQGNGHRQNVTNHQVLEGTGRQAMNEHRKKQIVLFLFQLT